MLFTYLLVIIFHDKDFQASSLSFQRTSEVQYKGLCPPLKDRLLMTSQPRRMGKDIVTTVLEI